MERLNFQDACDFIMEVKAECEYDRVYDIAGKLIKEDSDEMRYSVSSLFIPAPYLSDAINVIREKHGLNPVIELSDEAGYDAHFEMREGEGKSRIIASEYVGHFMDYCDAVREVFRAEIKYIKNELI